MTNISPIPHPGETGPHTPPDGTVLGMTLLGREVYLVPCAMCGAAVPVLRAQWQQGDPGPHVRAHNRFHTPGGTP